MLSEVGLGGCGRHGFQWSGGGLGGGARRALGSHSKDEILLVRF